VSFGAPKNLVVLTADKDANFAIESLIRRHADLGIRPIEADVVEHYLHDGAVLTKAHDFLRSYLKWDFSLVVFDHEGWSFYIFSSGGGAYELSIRDFGLEFLEKFGVLRHLLA